jgi:hypothetical protein
VQQGTYHDSGLANVAPFEGKGGRFDDLRKDRMPVYSFIARNQ